MLYIILTRCGRICRGRNKINQRNNVFPPFYNTIISPTVYKEHPLDCLDLLLSGVTSSGIYTIDPDGLGPIKVYCDQETFGGGWTLLFKRSSNKNFYQPWEDYKSGFGYLETSFWLGNDNIHRLTKVNNMSE